MQVHPSKLIKIMMEPKNHPIDKEKSFSKCPFWGSNLIFQGVDKWMACPHPFFPEVFREVPWQVRDPAGWSLVFLNEEPGRRIWEDLSGIVNDEQVDPVIGSVIPFLVKGMVDWFQRVFQGQFSAMEDSDGTSCWCQTCLDFHP